MSVPGIGTNQLCPKCGIGFFGGPKYVRHSLWAGDYEAVRELLERACSICGYTKTEPCKDAKESPS